MLTNSAGICNSSKIKELIVRFFSFLLVNKKVQYKTPHRGALFGYYPKITFLI